MTFGIQYRVKVDFVAKERCGQAVTKKYWSGSNAYWLISCETRKLAELKTHVGIAAVIVIRETPAILAFKNLLT